jgi:hypothetical protein
MIPQSHAIPQNSSISWLISFPISIFANNILNGIKFTATMIRINNNLLPPQSRLLISVHKMINRNGIRLRILRDMGRHAEGPYRVIRIIFKLLQLASKRFPF